MFTLQLVLWLSLAFQPKPGLAPQADPQAQLVVLKVGDEAEIDRGRLHLKFEEVLSDSRCPRGNRCIWAGEARVQVWAKEAAEPGRTLVIAGPARSFYDVSKNYSLQIRALEPYPEAGVEKPTEYRLTMAIRAATNDSPAK